ncbi:MAG TPA: rod shape-determining protein MreD [Vicinamibacterales bacterium]
MKAAGVLVAIALALALQTTLARFVVGGTAALDLVLVVVIYVALSTGPVTGMLAGSVAGIIQDALSMTTGVIGIGGLAKSIVGFAAGVIGQQFIVTAALPRFVMFLGATVLHATIFMGLYVLLELREFSAPWVAVASQAVINAAVGMIAFTIIESLPGFVERRRSRRVRH